MAKVAFTGSTEVGRRIAAGAAATIKRVTLELGGKSANVVFADADLERAAAAAPDGGVRQRRARTAARARASSSSARRSTASWPRLEARGRGDRVGDPLDEATEMGPLISADQRETVASYVPDDAPVAIRGSAPGRAGLLVPADGALPRSSNDDRAAREEIFGPVACVIPFGDEEEAIRLANDTIYGLSGSVWTRDGAQGAARRARARDRRALDQLEHLGARGHAVRRLQAVGRRAASSGPHALEHYTELKNVYYATEVS